MIHYKSALALIILLFVTLGCKKDSSSPVDTGNPPPTYLTKSPKRGICFGNPSPLTADLAAISGSVSWWYNWGTIPNITMTGIDFIPMLRGGNTSPANIAYVESFILAHPEVHYLLVVNEPNLMDQDNLTPAQAATIWPKYEQIISDLASQGDTVYLVGPQMNWGTMPGYSNPVVWLDSFYVAFRAYNGNRDPKIDYLGFHWYDYGLSAQLDNLQKYGKKIWITEMANWNSQINSYAKQAVQMQSMVNICETRSDVFRYAWFIARGTGTDNHYSWLFNSSGKLSDLGQLYNSLPFDTLNSN
jgi:hypothetical protein